MIRYAVWAYETKDDKPVARAYKDFHAREIAESWITSRPDGDRFYITDYEADASSLFEKVCSCGHKYICPPPASRYMDDGSPLSGHYWECHSCDSTLFMPDRIDLRKGDTE
jgi:hypothetical protein